MAMAHVSMADACAGFGAGYEHLIAEREFDGGQISKRAAVAAAAFGAVSALYPGRIARLRDRYDRYLNTLKQSGDRNIEEGIAVGEDVAGEVVAARAGDDVRSRLMAPYSPKGRPGSHDVDPCHKEQGFYAATWGELVPFVLTTAERDEVAGAAPPSTLESPA